MTASTLTREQVLARLDALASVSHALIVEFLTVQCALGHRLDPAPGAAGEAVASAARGAAGLAMDEMRRLHHLNDALVAAEQSPQVMRAETVGTVAFAPMTVPELERLAERERAIAHAVDDQYRPLCDALPVIATLFDEPARSAIERVLDPCPQYAPAVGELVAQLDGIAPAGYIRARPRDPADALEEKLVVISDRCYRVIVDVLAVWFTDSDVAFGLRSPATASMDNLDDVNLLLVERGVLPPFTA